MLHLPWCTFGQRIIKSCFFVIYIKCSNQPSRIEPIDFHGIGISAFSCSGKNWYTRVNILDMTAITALPLENNYINGGLFDSQPMIDYRFRLGLTPNRYESLSGRNIEKWRTVVSIFLFRKTDFQFFLIGYELSPCKNGRFNMDNPMDW